MEAMAALIVTSGRDIRLDLFRGLALWFIFVDHIPTNVVGWADRTQLRLQRCHGDLRLHLGLYGRVIAYARMMEREGWVRAAAPSIGGYGSWLCRPHSAVRRFHGTGRLGLDRPRHTGADRGDGAARVRPEPYQAILEAALLKFR